MNKKTLLTHSQKSVLRFAPIFNEASMTSILLFLLTVTTLVISATINAHAACQTPQLAIQAVLTVSRPVAVAHGDFNGDGTVDLAVLRNIPGGTFPGTVVMFLGNGGGGFTSTGIQYNATQSTATDLAAGDFNNDGRLDLAASASGTVSGVQILRGNGSGGFNSPTNFSVVAPDSLAVGDFNNDGNADIIAKNGVFSTPFASILPGLGNGNFGAAINVPTDGYGNTVRVKDLNNDGFLDFVTVNDSNPAATISIRLGNGSFIFTNPPPIVASGAVDVTINDFTNDGKQDFLVVRRGSGNGSLDVFLGVGDGTFNSPIGSPFALPNQPLSITSADFNGDNIPDTAIGNSSATNSLTIALTFVEGAFALSPEQGASERVYALDYNRNGATDLVIVKEISQNKVVLLRNNCPPPSKTKFDFDGDRKSDISVFRPDNGVWYLLRSQAGFTAAQFGISTDKPVPADYDGDGKTDIAVFRDGIWFWLNSSNNTFSGFQFGIAGDVPVPADFTGDGHADLVIYRGGLWCIGDHVTFQFGCVQFGIQNDKPYAGDFNGDGFNDLAVYRDGIWYFLLSFQGFSGIQFGIASDKPVPADYDGDGETDLAVYRDGIWYLLQSSQGFVGVQFGLASDIPVPADYDGDGKSDIAVFRPANGTWYLLNSQTGFTGVQFGIASDRPIPAAFVP